MTNSTATTFVAQHTVSGEFLLVPYRTREALGVADPYEALKLGGGYAKALAELEKMGDQAQDWVLKAWA